MYKLRLFITGNTPSARKLIAKLKDILDSDCGGQYTLDVIDIFAHPDIAASDKVFATPTLIKTLPPPVRRIIGDLIHRERVLEGLHIEILSS